MRRSATVTLNVDGVSWVHEAYALGIGAGPDAPAGSEATPEREALLDVHDTADGSADAWSVPTSSARSRPFEPEEYLIRAVPVDRPRRAWAVTGSSRPSSSGRRLPGSRSPTRANVPSSRPPTSVTCSVEANQLTLFTEGDVTYQVIAVQRLPHRTCE